MLVNMDAAAAIGLAKMETLVLKKWKHFQLIL